MPRANSTPDPDADRRIAVDPQTSTSSDRFDPSHRSQIETVLDETTAELVKCAVTPDVATVEFAAKIKKAVRLHETYRVDCEVTRATSVRVWTRAEISDPKDGNVYATCEACLADLGAIARLGK